MRDSQLHIENKRELSVANAWNYMGGHCTEKTYTGRGHSSYFLDWGNKNIYWEGGTLHIFCLLGEHLGWGGDTAQH